MAAAASSALSATTVASASVTIGRPKSRATTTRRVVYLPGMNNYQGLRSQNSVVCRLGLPVSTEQSFANMVRAMQASPSNANGGGALSSTCNAAAEIFKIAAIMNGITLVGVAIGFVLLRIEASLEEAE